MPALREEDGVVPVNGSGLPGVGDGYAQRVRELGDMLRRTRESRGLGIEEVVEATKVRSRYLVAIEQGDLSILPGTVYARGFIRNYADFLGVNGIEVANAYLGPLRDEDMSEPQTSRSSTPAKSRPNPQAARPKQAPANKKGSANALRAAGSRSTSRRTLAVAAAVVALFIFAVFIYAWMSSRPGQTAASSLLQKQPQITRSLGRSSGQKATGNVGAVGRPRSNHGQVGHTAPSVVLTRTGVSQSQESFSVATNQPLTVKVADRTGKCWLQVTADGKVVVPSLILLPGETRTWTAQQNVQLILGANQTVQVTVNGVAVPVAGVNGRFVYSFTKK